MTHEDIKKFLYVVIDMEKNQFVQERAWSHLNRMSQQLGIRANIQKPVGSTADAYLTEDETDRINIISGIVAVLYFLINIFSCDGGFKGTFFAVIIAVILFIIINLVARGIVAEKGRQQSQKYLDQKYITDMEAYKNAVAADEQRVKNELCRRNFIYSEMKALEKQYQQTKNNLDKLYSSNIIAHEYRHDMVAICSFYQYLMKGMTYSLTFDRATGDKGAYNIYEEEKRLGRVVSKLDDVLNRLDRIIDNQQVIAGELREANNNISKLCNGVDRISRQISAVNSSIKEQTAVQQYNEQRKYNEMRYMNMMNSIHIWHY